MAQAAATSGYDLLVTMEDDSNKLGFALGNAAARLVDGVVIYAPSLRISIEFDFSQHDTMTVKYLIEILNNPDMLLHQRILLSNLIVRESTRKIDMNVTGQASS
jgi:DNA-binding LacI/PurR family transcriptional regulator